MIYEGPRCNVVVLSAEEIFVIVPHKMCDLPNSELHRGFFVWLGNAQSAMTAAMTHKIHPNPEIPSAS